MSKIQDEAYSEAMEEIERLKALIAELAQALEQQLKASGNTHPDWQLIVRARDHQQFP